MSTPLHRRILSKACVNKETGCWEWLGAKNSIGYGVVWLRGRNEYLHRMFCEHKHGPAPKNHETRHLCHNRACFNPNHLRWGTSYENYMDARQRGSVPLGENHSSSKLTVNCIRAIRASQQPAKELAEIYGVSRQNITFIQNGKTWRHIE